MISILQRATVRGRVWPGTLRRRASRLLAALDVAAADLVVTLTDDVEIQALNAEWRGQDKPTDVLSFPQDAPVFPGMPRTLGDVVISVETAARQAAEGALPRVRDLIGARPWSVSDEVSFLMLHGLLHLLGHDHEDEAEAELMESKEAALLPCLLGARSR